MTSVPLWRRVAGILLIAYGVAGIVLLVVGGQLLASSASRLDGLAKTLETQRAVLVRSLDATSKFLADAEKGTGNVDASLGATVDIARQVGSLTQSLADAMTGVADASTINIFGNQPFAGLSRTFADVAAKAEAISSSIDKVATSVAANRTDLDNVHDDLGAIRAEIDNVRVQLAGTTGLGGADLGAVSNTIDTSRIVLIGLLVWLTGQAVIAIIVGFVLATRRTTVRIPAPPPALPVDDVI